jgi:DNA (cytosine-5)-methyltransferase 1
MRHLDLFSGIGGFALATEMAWDNVEHIFCDNDSFSQAILRKHWPNSPIYGDIKELTKDRIVADTESKRERSEQGADREHEQGSKRVESGSQRSNSVNPYSIDILTGGFPCQPFSAAGRRAGTEDDRHLWPEMLRVIRETNPAYVLGENVGGLLTWDGGLVLEMVLADLESAGYEAGAFVIPACALNAPHRRDRVWIAAFNPEHARQHGTENGEGRIARGDGNEARKNEDEQPARPALPRHDTFPGESGWDEDWPEVAARLCLVDDGLPDGLARPRGWRNAALKGAGNAIVPQVAAEILKAMKSSSDYGRPSSLVA